MNRSLRRVAAGLMLLGTSSIFAPACAENESSLFVRGVMAPEATSCLFPAPSGDAIQLFAGSLDLAVASVYTAGLIVGNQLVRRGDEDKIRTETSRIELYAADVTILGSNQEVLQRSDGGEAAFETPITGFIDPGSGTEPNYGVAGVLLIDSGTAEQLRGELGAGGFRDLLVTIVVRGRTLGGTELESGEFQFPITVCVNCLAIRPSVLDDPGNAPVVDCDLATEAECPCLLGQDGRFDCCCAGVAACGG